LEKIETDKEKIKKLETLYGMVMDYQEQNHRKNQKRIQIGLRCLYIVPAIFLFLLLVTGSSKIIFLVLWIISLFGIAIYLIVVEYLDYNIQKNTNALEGRKHEPVESLINMDRFEETVERFETNADRIEAAVDKVTNAARIDVAMDKVANTARELLKPDEKTTGEESKDDQNT
jgi:hypothetical protein